MDEAEIRRKVAAAGQEHVFRFWPELSPAEREALLADLAGVDWEQLSRWVAEYVVGTPRLCLPPNLSPPEVYPAAPQTAAQQQLYREAEACGRELLHQGRVAAFTVAGGQGTRLGYDGPKGSYRLSPIRQKPLFQLFAEALLRWGELAGRPVPWYLMTSEANDAVTREFFAAHDYFGLPRSEVFFFVQGMMPAFSLTGRLLLAEKGRLALSPDGHGGSLRALHRSGALADMARRGIEEISYFQVDNPLVSVVSTRFIGLHHRLGAEMSCRSLTKREPLEKLGNFCMSEGRLHMIEYSDLPEELARQRRPDGTLFFTAGSPAIHVLQRRFVERLNAGGFALPWHRAVKKVPYTDDAGQPQKPTAPNGVKLESFVFDALPLAERTLVLEAVREREFAPVKNAEGDDSPTTARQLLQEEHARWLLNRGRVVPRGPDGRLALRLEISPRSYVTEGDFARATVSDLPLVAGTDVYIA